MQACNSSDADFFIHAKEDTGLERFKQAESPKRKARSAKKAPAPDKDKAAKTKEPCTNKRKADKPAQKPIKKTPPRQEVGMASMWGFQGINIEDAICSGCSCKC